MSGAWGCLGSRTTALYCCSDTPVSRRLSPGEQMTQAAAKQPSFRPPLVTPGIVQTHGRSRVYRQFLGRFDRQLFPDEREGAASDGIEELR
jgi:hypothetical protein